jgi:C1A family cysteine protease
MDPPLDIEMISSLREKFSFDEVAGVRNGTVPTTFDWRTSGCLTPVKDQGQCGSCAAFSAVESVESSVALASSGAARVCSTPPTALSVEQILECELSDLACDGGILPLIFDYIVKAGGLESDEEYPYCAQCEHWDKPCKFKESDVASSISTWRWAAHRDDVPSLIQSIAESGPVSVCVDAAAWPAYTGGVHHCERTAFALDHCVQAVGYNQTAKTLLIRNSWGTDWGENGYMQLSYDGNTDPCGITLLASQPVA